MKLIVGLGNPGKEYEKTRHNVGFLVLDEYLKENSWITKKDYFLCEKIINNEKIIFIKPQTYMNLSGKAVAQVVNFYKIPYENILVIHDDLDLKEGMYKLKFNSSSGGHNGIKSIIEYLNTNKFGRLKIGIGNNKKITTASYVLGELSNNEVETLKSKKYQEIIEFFIINGIEKTMNTYNSKGSIL